MALQNLTGQGLWLPANSHGFSVNANWGVSDTGILANDLEELQIIGDIVTEDGRSHIFGNSGSAIEWMTGAVTFNAVSTLTVGFKQASSIDAATGPPIRATTGKAAFDVYKDLVAGTDSLAATTARSDAMATLAASAITVNNGDQGCVSFFLSKASGTSSIVARQAANSQQFGYPGLTLVTASGVTFTAQTQAPNVMLKFDDGYYGWIFPSIPISAISSASPGGITNIVGNIIRVPFRCKVNAMMATLLLSANTQDFALDMYSTPLGTPALMATAAIDANEVSNVASANRNYLKAFSTPQIMEANTDYCFGVRQTTANNILGVHYRDVFSTSWWQASGSGAECYAANSTAGATFASQNSGKRRYAIWALVSALDNSIQESLMGQACL